MSSLKRHEGYLLIDNRYTPGVPDEVIRKLEPELPAGAGRGVFEAPTYTCSHCQRVVIINPMRTRERAYCSGCDHYICDECGARKAITGCKTFKQIIEEAQEAAATNQPIIIATK